MRRSLRAGFNFGLTSGVITTLGLMVGLNSSTNSKLVVIGGILIIAIADALSDSLGMHCAAESQNRIRTRELWEVTYATFVYKFLFSAIFIFPVLFFELSKAVLMCIFIGLYLIFVNGLVLARAQKISPIKVICEHIILTVIVIITTHFIGVGVSTVIV